MDIYEKARGIAANYIGARMYTCREIEDRLRRKGIDKDTAEQVVADFAKIGALDDRLYAEAYVNQAIRLSAKGAYRIRQELYAKGVARSIIDDVLADTSEDTEAALSEYIESHRLCENISSRRDLEKLKARLARRGFSPSEIRECLGKYDFELED